MPLPLAAIATAATAAGMEYLRQRNQAGTGPQVGKLVIGGTAVRASTIAALGGAAGAGLVAGGGPSTGVAAIIERALGGGGGGGLPPGATMTAPSPAPAGAAALQRLIRGANAIQQFTITGGRKKYRRMDHCNIKALRRAGRRLEGFVKLAKSMVQLHTRAKLKKPRRRR